MIKLNRFQTEAAERLSDEINKGGVIRFNMPTGAGRTITVASAVGQRKCLFVSPRSEMRSQFVASTLSVGMPNVEAMSIIGALRLTKRSGVVIICETVRNQTRADLIERFTEFGCTVLEL